MVAAVAIFLVAVGVWWAELGTTVSAPSLGMSTVTAGPLLPRLGPSGVWTGSEMVIWGGGHPQIPNGVSFGDGARFDPSSSEWTKLAPAPLTARSGHVGVWTGSQTFVWGGSDEAGKLLTDGALYDPATDSWSFVPNSPDGSGRGGAKALWIDGHVVIAGGSTESGYYNSDVLTLNLATLEWEAIELSGVVLSIAAHNESAVVALGGPDQLATTFLMIRPTTGEIEGFPTPDMAAQSGPVILVGGSDGSLAGLVPKGPRTDLIEFDSSSNQWSIASSFDSEDLPLPRIDEGTQFDSVLQNDIVSIAGPLVVGFIDLADGSWAGRMAEPSPCHQNGASVRSAPTVVILWGGQTCTEDLPLLDVGTAFFISPAR